MFCRQIVSCIWVCDYLIRLALLCFGWAKLLIALFFESCLPFTFFPTFLFRLPWFDGCFTFPYLQVHTSIPSEYGYLAKVLFYFFSWAWIVISSLYGTFARLLIFCLSLQLETCGIWLLKLALLEICWILQHICGQAMWMDAATNYLVVFQAQCLVGHHWWKDLH